MKKKNNYLLIIIIIILSLFNLSKNGYTMENKSFFDFELELINGEKVNLEKYEGKAILLVNVASNCGFTNQYSDLQNLWEKYKDKNLVVIGVPSNQFGGQEPGSNEEIKNFCEVNFNINFPLSAITEVKGENAHDVFVWAKKNHGKAAVPKWNFHKILINKDGKVEDTFASFTKPTSKKIISKIEEIL